jgi:tryptophanyl-tRNA synthetase
MATKGRVFSGMRPSGKLHLGNWLGALQNWVALQDAYECIYCAVDIHALTTLGSHDDIPEIQNNVREMVIDWLAAGVDPNRSIIFVQSQVPEVLTLHTLLSMVTPLGWLMRVPTFKDRVRQMDETEETVSYGLVGYPVLQTADIVLYKADTVPVGEDQIPHIELAREIVRRFNNLFGPTFPEPQHKLTQTPLILGLEGQQKMSKSLDNQVELGATPAETKARIATAFTDPQRLRRSDPGRPEVCNVYTLHKVFNTKQTQVIATECRSALRGCVDCKNELSESINSTLEEFREKRAVYEARPEIVREILIDGGERASKIARATIAEVSDRMGLQLPHR